MKPEEAKKILLQIIVNGRISINGAPLTANELGHAQQAVLSLYNKAKDAEEAKEPENKKPAEEKKC